LDRSTIFAVATCQDTLVDTCRLCKCDITETASEEIVAATASAVVVVVVVVVVVGAAVTSVVAAIASASVVSVVAHNHFSFPIGFSSASLYFMKNHI